MLKVSSSVPLGNSSLGTDLRGGRRCPRLIFLFETLPLLGLVLDEWGDGLKAAIVRARVYDVNRGLGCQEMSGELLGLVDAMSRQSWVGRDAGGRSNRGAIVTRRRVYCPVGAELLMWKAAVRDELNVPVVVHGCDAMRCEGGLSLCSPPSTCPKPESHSRREPQ